VVDSKLSSFPEQPIASSSQPLPDARHAEVRVRRPLVRRYSAIVRLAHWLNAVFLLGMIASGLQIYNAYAHFGIRGNLLPVPNPLDGQPIPAWGRLGGWLAGGLNWHFMLAWPFVITGVMYLTFLAISGEWRSLLFRPRDIGPALQMQLYYLRLRREHPLQGKHNALQKAAYTFIVVLGAISALSGFAIYKPIQLSWLTSLFGGYELARYWHFVAVWLFIAFTLLHVTLVFVVDPSSLRGMITGWYRGRFPSHD
jgi:thiosulfate reductase cytochrome b subunit